MKYHIIMDSVGDLTEELENFPKITRIPLQIHIGNDTITDDGKISQEEILEQIKSSKEAPKSSCPSPQLFYDHFQRHWFERLYVIAGSSKLTGSYNSAKLAERMLKETYPATQIHVFDSKTGCAGQTLLLYLIMKLEQEDHSFESIVGRIEQMIEKQETRFVLEDLSFLQKNGRLTGIKSFVVEALHIVPLLKATEEGEIIQAGMARGIQRAMQKFEDYIVDEIRNTRKYFVIISHCNCIERAKQMQERLERAIPYIEVKIAKTGGISTLYAGDGGLVVSY